MSADSVTTEPQLYYIHTDYLGTPQELTDRDGHLHWVGQYRAWGELTKANDSEGNAASVEMPLRFQGQYFDSETGLHYNRFRYYDPQIGRFTTPDSISLAGGINLYQYAPNPVQWVDPFGLSKKSNDECPLKNVQKLPPLKGKSTSHVEEILECNGYTCKNPQNPKKTDAGFMKTDRKCKFMLVVGRELQLILLEIMHMLISR